VAVGHHRIRIRAEGTGVIKLWRPTGGLRGSPIGRKMLRIAIRLGSRTECGFSLRMRSAAYRLFRDRKDGGDLPDPNSEYNRLLPDFWIVEGRNIPWDRYTADLAPLFAAEASLVLYEPWWPGRRKRADAFRAGLEVPVEDLNGTLLARVPPHTGLTDVFDTWHHCGGANSGQWLIATPLISWDALAACIRTGLHTGPATFIATEVPEELQSALALDEGGMGTLFVRRDQPAFPALLQLLQRLPT
jgi:hypothetical protein